MRVLFTAGPKDGQVVDVPLDEARRYLDLRVARRLGDDDRVTDVERAYAAEKRAAKPKLKRRPKPKPKPEATGAGEGEAGGESGE